MNLDSPRNFATNVQLIDKFFLVLSMSSRNFLKIPWQVFWSALNVSLKVLWDAFEDPFIIEFLQTEPAYDEAEMAPSERTSDNCRKLGSRAGRASRR